MPWSYVLFIDDPERDALISAASATPLGPMGADVRVFYPGERVGQTVTIEPLPRSFRITTAWADADTVTGDAPWRR